MGSAFQRPAPELVEVGQPFQFFSNYAQYETLPDGNVLIFFAVQHGSIADVKAHMIAAPHALTQLGRMCFHASGAAHNDMTMRLVAGQH